jgi:hypothetical protein
LNPGTEKKCCKIVAGCDGTHLRFLHLRSCGRRITSLMPPGLHIEFHTTLEYIVRLCLKKRRTMLYDSQKKLLIPDVYLIASGS